MAHSPRFNYIITIHNKAGLIEQVLMCVLMCSREHSHIYPVLDGCTDRTEEIIDGIINANAGVPITKVNTPDVHEIRAANAGLAAADQEGDGYNIILQDDVLLAEFHLERKVNDLYHWVGPRLGFVSFRLGANFAKDAAVSDAAVPFVDLVENAYGHGLANAEVLLPGQFAYRSTCMKSPVCIPFTLVRNLGVLEEKLAPYMHDDTEYSIRCSKAGYMNGVLGIRFHSDVRWGTTRTKKKAKELTRFTQRNMRIIREIHGAYLAHICSQSQSSEITEVPTMVDQEEQALAIEAWKRNKAQLQMFRNARERRFSSRMKSIVRRLGV